MSENKYDVVFTPDAIQNAIAGQKGKKKARPILFDTRFFKVNMKDESGNYASRLMVYLLFGGVPPKNIHEALTENGFKVRRRPAAWKKKDGEVVEVKGNNYECYVVYYLDGELGADQIEVIGRCMSYFNTVIEKKNHSGLLTSWEQIDQQYSDEEDEWLKICTVTENGKATKATPTSASTPAIKDFSDVQGMF